MLFENDLLTEEIPEKEFLEPVKADTSKQLKTDKELSITKSEADKRKVSPLIGNLAKKLGVNIEDVIGTGPGGIITREDILRTKESD